MITEQINEANFKTNFNPLVPIVRLILLLFLFGSTSFLIYLLYRDFNTNGIKQYVSIILGVLLFASLFILLFKVYISTTKNYLINDTKIEECNLLTFKTKTIYKDDIKGFSTSIVPYRIWNFKQVIIYLKDGTKIDMMQFAYFNFKNIKPALVAKKYTYLGYEPYYWKGLNSRVYHYED